MVGIIFEWIGQERCSIDEVCRRLRREGIPTRTGKAAWDRATIWLMLKNPTYNGTAAFRKTRSGPLRAEATPATARLSRAPQAPNLMR